MTRRCHYSDSDRDEILVSYLYDEIDAAERAAFDAHLATCDVCRSEVTALRGLRSRLAGWSPPERAPLFGTRGDQVAVQRGGVWRTLGAIPLWAQVAAAMLIAGVAVGVANVRVQYGRDGLVVQTGWSSPAAVTAPAGAPAPWRVDLTALEGRLRAEFRAADAETRAAAAAPAPSDRIAGTNAELIRRVQALIDESERRQRREGALRVAEGVAGVMRDVQRQRHADLVAIDQSLGYIQNDTRQETLKQRQLISNLVYASQRQ